jgi:IS30 family transposase
MNLPIPVVSIAKRKVNKNLNGRQATRTCQSNNPSAVKYAMQHLAPLQSQLDPTQLNATKPNEILHFDFLYIGSSRDGKYQYLLLLKDDLSGYLWLVPCRTADAAATFDALMRWFAVFGVVLLWISDRGSHFKNEVVQRVQKELKAKYHFTSANCPWSNGTIEFACKQVIRACRAVLSEPKKYADERPEKFSVYEAEQEDAHASLHWTRGDYTARADVEG